MEIKKFFEKSEVQKKFAELLGEEARSFIISVLQNVSSNERLKRVTPESVYGAAITAAILKLPVNFGYAYIVPYNNVAQFQIGYKGLIQLALRSNQFEIIKATDVRNGEIITLDRLTGSIEYKWIEDFDAREKANIIGYVSYFKLKNGFSSQYFMTINELKQHAHTYSETYKKQTGVWVNNFNAMALKTVLKLNLSKYAPLTSELKRAIEFDQAVTIDGESIEYVDNKQSTVELKDLFHDNNDNT